LRSRSFFFSFLSDEIVKKKSNNKIGFSFSPLACEKIIFRSWKRIDGPEKGRYFTLCCSVLLVAIKFRYEGVVKVRGEEEDLRLLFGLLGQEDGLDVREDTALCDGHAGEEFVQFFVVPDGQLKMPGDDAGLFVVPGGVTGQFEHFGG